MMNAVDWEFHLIPFKFSHLKHTFSQKLRHSAERYLYLTRLLLGKTAHDENTFPHQRDLSTPKSFVAGHLIRTLRNGEACSEYRFSVSQ